MGIYTITKDFTMDCAHKLEDYCGACANLHGHTYKIEVTCVGEKLNELGLLVDFKDIKGLVHGKYDHRCLNDFPEFDASLEDGVNPTAENMARIIWEDIAMYCSSLLNEPRCTEVKVWETATSCASFRP